MSETVDTRCLYSETHEWLRMENGHARVGISHYAQEQLGDVVYVELPEVGDELDKGAPFGVVESVKAASDVYMPVAGKITATNPEVEQDPTLLNRSPYEEGWLIEIELTDPTQTQGLMDSAGYEAYLSELEE